MKLPRKTAQVGSDPLSNDVPPIPAVRMLSVIAGAVMALLVPACSRAQELPHGGSVTAGSASISSPNSSTLNVNQSSDRAIINWNSFSVGTGGTVNFNQPSAASATLNRVTGNTPSSIAGTINAPGTVLLVNPNGIAITKDGVINTGSFAASTLDIKDKDFLSGNYKFTGNGNSQAVTNAGHINVSDGGFAALLGGQVANDGVIRARLGKVALGSGELITLDLSGDGFLSVAVPAKDLGKIKGVDGQTLVTNRGKIIADGGVVELKAATAAGILRDAVNVPGSIRANSVGLRNGRIVLGGGLGGRVRIAGRLKARGRRRRHSNGGSVRVTGATIDLTGKVEVSAVGRRTHGGDVSVVADDTLNFGGLIVAEGGEGGSGGFVETSGAHVHIGDGASVLTLASDGTTGTWLIDPQDFTIAASGGDIKPTVLESELVGNNVTIKSSDGATAGSGDIFVNDAVTWSSGNSLTLDAYRNIDVNADITNSGGADVNLRADSSGTGTGTVNFSGGQVSTSGVVSIFYNPTGNDNTTVNATSYTAPTDYSADVTGSGALKSYMLVNTVFDLQNVNNNLGSAYALGRDINASGTASWNGNAGFVPIGTDGAGNILNGGNGFSGAFDGLGHAISGLTIDRSSSDYVGLFGYATGAMISDVGLVGGSVSGHNEVGDLAGHLSGSGITQAYATGAITGSGGYVGGLVGKTLYLTVITQAYATGAVSGHSKVGGLVGGNEFNSLITQAYATGAVSGSVDDVGGLVGENAVSFIDQAYATGAVSAGASAVGGLIGYNDGGVIAHAYYDSDTTGPAGGIGIDSNHQSVTSLTTRQLQGLDPISGSIYFSTATNLNDAGGATWAGGANGLYPYLKSFFPSGVQAISGVAYKDAGLTPLASTAAGTAYVSAVADGVDLGSITTGANGYYYILEPNGTFSSGNSILAYTKADATTGATRAATLTIAGSNVVSGIDIYGNALMEATSATQYSATAPLSALLINALAADGGNTGAADAINATTSFGVLGTASRFDFDQSEQTSGNLIIAANSVGGTLTISSPVEIDGSGSLTLHTVGALAINAPITVVSAGAVMLNTSIDAAPGASLLALSFAQGAGIDYGSTDRGGTLTINGVSYTLVYSTAQLDGLDGYDATTSTGTPSSVSGNYALATDLIATGKTYTDALIGTSNTSPFSGTLEGLGHTITGLTVDKSGSYAGLIGYSNGMVRDIGMIGGRITGGGDDVGGLVGENNTGVIAQAYATGSVTGSGDYVGGLAGQNVYYGSLIVQAYATGAVSGGNYVGGLVGESGNGSYIEQVYATGAVSGGSDVGGLVGQNYLTAYIIRAYATGAVSGGSNVGGVVGENVGATVLDGYYDSDTTGQGRGIGLGDSSQVVSALTTRQLQGLDPISGSTYFSVVDDLGDGSSSVFSGGSGGRYPYLTSFFPNGAQAISGTAFNGSGGELASTSAGAGNVSAIANGVDLGSVTTGKNGYYYILTPNGMFSTGDSILAYTNADAMTGATNAATLATAINALNQTDVNIYPNALTASTGETSLTAVDSALTAAINAAANGNTTAPVAVSGANSWNLTATGASFTVDRAVTTSGTFSVQTTATDAPIIVASPIEIDGSGNLGLQASGALAIDAPITVTGAGRVSLAADLQSIGCSGCTTVLDLSFGQGDSIDFGAVDQGATLSINGHAYTLLYTMGDVAGINTDAGLQGKYALATSLDALTDVTTPASWTPLGADIASQVLNSHQGFNGTFEGLGHTISNLTVDSGSVAGGLFGYIGITNTDYGTVRDLTLANATIKNGHIAAILAGESFGNIVNVAVSGTVDGTGIGSTLGGLVAENAGSIANSSAAVTINGGNGSQVGGLVGLNGFVIVGSYATGAVSAMDDGAVVGGLAGENKGYIALSYATASATAGGDGAAVGGLVGANFAEVAGSYATGAATAGDGGADVGGLVGYNNLSGIIVQAYATGSATGGNDGAWVGGLVGENYGGIKQSYAMGAAHAGLSGGGSTATVGGLVGYNLDGTSITESYSTGAVSSSDPFGVVGGFIGYNDSTTPSDVDGNYFDTLTAGATLGIGDGNAAAGVTGQTTAQLQGALPAGFDNTIWGTDTNLYPYFLWQYPTTPQAVSGFAYSDAGSTPLASGNSGPVYVSGLVDGAGIGTATTGANGYYYLLAPDGTLTGTQHLLTYVDNGSVAANTYFEAPKGTVTNFDLYGGYLRVFSGAATTSAMLSGVPTAIGGNNGSNFLYGVAGFASGTSLDFEASNTGGFSVDGALDVGSGTIIFNAVGPVSQSAALTANGLELLGASASYTLDDSGNHIGLLAADTGAVSLTDSTDLTLGTVNGTVGVTGSGAVTAVSSGNLTIAAGAKVTANGGADVVLVAGGNFTNNEGSDAVEVSGGGRWLVYSNAPAGDAFGNLDSGNTAVWNASYASLPPASVTQVGNRYLFAYQPTLTFTTTDVTKTYGDDATAAVAAAYAVSGLEKGISGAYLGGTAAGVYSGVPSVTSLGSTPPAVVSGSPYPIIATAGTVIVQDGYALAFSNTGVLTVKDRAPTPNTTQPKSPSGGNDTTPTTISFQQNQSNTPIKLTTLRAPANQNIAPGSGPESLYPPISQFDSTQYTNGTLPDFAPQAGEATVLTMVARAEENNRKSPKIDALWRAGAAGWPAHDHVLKNVRFSDGNGQSRTPAGSNGFGFTEGSTDIAALLKHRPVILGGAASAGQAATMPWLLALKMTADGKGIIANDPLTGDQVILAYDPATKTVGGVTAVFDPKTGKPVPLGTGAPTLTGQKTKVPDVVWSELKTFKPTSYFAVSI